MPRMAASQLRNASWYGSLQRGLGIDAEDGTSPNRSPGFTQLQRGLGIDAEDGNWLACGSG